MGSVGLAINQKIISTLDALGFPILCNELYKNNELEQLESLFNLLEMMLFDQSLDNSIKHKIEIALATSNNGILIRQQLKSRKNDSICSINS
ncbi:hypothetical protein [Pseudoalteromonas tunicata]|jgi:hypothetical protein|uniref:Uncharacterized protein n=1 Tax=Pseudoalteromonas tunicata D2 TaxID=87626 RepID=A4C4S9_9GAMM|nr:hypothetical protein [Pseudoalteromonas tunicata]ATC96960.1 hypothetical protein PTUN_b0601 [Pseudoalteromonas tunicata]AXT33085.1 hypothetical protein D1819_19895 [Pseudoalteromonas tunicata]EAR30561.1 hypothetical protein PTD2_03291 [Pseudoalteromonas tunicata D2]MDP4983963.1 hypothetical protein [Pseudoalteromonas tunicata]MDP5213918.1 hypothetical protein [Pseudoalteromonas tunicata]